MHVTTSENNDLKCLWFKCKFRFPWKVWNKVHSWAGISVIRCAGGVWWSLTRTRPIVMGNSGTWNWRYLTQFNQLLTRKWKSRSRCRLCSIWNGCSSWWLGEFLKVDEFLKVEKCYVFIVNPLEMRSKRL